VQNEKVFRHVVKAAFAQRRKTLRNALRAAGYSDLDAAAKRTGIDLQRRGETLSLAKFATLTNAFAESKDLQKTSNPHSGRNAKVLSFVTTVGPFQAGKCIKMRVFKSSGVAQASFLFHCSPIP
jgi:hypothetical protein